MYNCEYWHTTRVARTSDVLRLPLLQGLLHLRLRWTPHVSLLAWGVLVRFQGYEIVLVLFQGWQIVLVLFHSLERNGWISASAKCLSELFLKDPAHRPQGIRHLHGWYRIRRCDGWMAGGGGGGGNLGLEVA